MDAAEPSKHFEASGSLEDADFTLGSGTYFALRMLEMNGAGAGHWRPFGGFTSAY
jgi:hypothetical protein